MSLVLRRNGILDTLSSPALVFAGRSEANFLVWGFPTTDSVIGSSDHVLLLGFLSILMLFPL
jgi:hypothetical protein